ncbi:hypothetical protein K466DRAFT_549038 [Polyporus arcularius HHB13444]|uniref:guanosine-diphosphatase n=1 Tax=Polyporus arcularius HHB13444 TaxID=1314778 RepID=A0A5C3PMJ1_9APHY|nr:hypothetical protein K466DRAFT_549038 [Polyporus arcularius HHB13444]
MLSPRSSNYKRLEGGTGPSREPAGRSFAWKKSAIRVVVFIGLVYSFGPRRGVLNGYVSLSSIMRPDTMSNDCEMTPAPEPLTTEHPDHPQSAPAAHDDDSPPTAHPTDPASDGDLTKTHHCAKPYKAGVPLVQFALMIDMSSVGSRIHIYKFNNCGPSPAFEYEVSKYRHGEISFYRTSPRTVAESLDSLLDEAVRVVPESLRGCTPVQVKVTAAIRRLGAKVARDVVAAIRLRLEEKYLFSLQSDNAVEIMEGREQSIYAWLTANYLLSTLSADPSAQKTPPYAVLGLGFALAEIIFEPTFDVAKPDAQLEESEHKYELMYDGQRRVLYEHSHRGYGMVTARQSTHRIVDSMSNHSEDAVVTNPCLARGTNRTVEIIDEKMTGKNWRSVTMVGGDVGSWESCNEVVELVLNKDASCEVQPCSFNGVYQPSLLETFPHGKILLLHFFDDRLSPFLTTTANPLKAPIHVSAFADLAKIVCRGPTAWKEHWGSDAGLMQELERRPEWCLDLTYMNALLLGYGLEGDREIQLGTQFGGMELGWCLGASVATIAGVELNCRV